MASWRPLPTAIAGKRCSSLLLPSIHPPRPNPWVSSRTGRVPTPRQCRFLSEEAVSDRHNSVQVYVSRTTNPYMNLAIENFLLESSFTTSFILFLYTNRPCVVIGRNQNPWAEVDFSVMRDPNALADARRACGADADSDMTPGDEEETHIHGSGTDILLVRRRSGGGTVFHDLGNVNYSVICPTTGFNRNTHAAMVVHALRHGLGISARVNERHDIVVDDVIPPGPGDSDGSPKTETFKVSGSAFKIIKNRALHHGTCLLRSPHLPLLGRLLRSPAAPYIWGNGVSSVPSPVRNLFPGLERTLPNGVDIYTAFEQAVIAQFTALYGQPNIHEVIGDGGTEEKKTPISSLIREIDDIRVNYALLKSSAWIFENTPFFAFKSYRVQESPKNSNDVDMHGALSQGPPSDLRASITLRQGRILSAVFSVWGKPINSQQVRHLIRNGLFRIEDWRHVVGDDAAGEWLNRRLVTGSFTDSRVTRSSNRPGKRVVKYIKEGGGKRTGKTGKKRDRIERGRA
ncbi:hypothetical protein GGS23DRAFT_562752 [Durotheca rogersii]|uniref:uncharacterized protein n=1 Tax=Durotheca rogersii TaxID=419775 RepID=UPI002220E635|nr:uncharacterized protein GGS23DRAFT_562752 [Durotheca rogersii]KAI5864065.1 hypothetical protein GGS23DRAFT_562752 [Durotheca rogersii]